MTWPIVKTEVVKQDKEEIEAASQSLGVGGEKVVWSIQGQSWAQIREEATWGKRIGQKWAVTSAAAGGGGQWRLGGMIGRGALATRHADTPGGVLKVSSIPGVGPVLWPAVESEEQPVEFANWWIGPRS